MNFNNTFKKNAIALAVTSATVLAGGISGGVYAQSDEEQTLEEVVVTGSRIKRADLTAISPVSVVSGEEFVISGNLNIEQKIAELPQTLPSFGPSSNNPGDGTARVDLRGLGTGRTLVLVNGRRYIPSTQTGIVDLNTIPGTLIKQVDITTGGASAVYGSDALAGVVNFQLVDDFEGVELTTLYDVTEEGDGEKFNIDLTLGGNFDDGRGNAVLYTSYSRRDAVFQDSRSFSENALVDRNSQLVPGGSSGVPGTRVFGGPALPNGQNVGIFEQDGSARTFQNPQDLFNYAPDNFLQLPQDRVLITGLAHYDISEKARAYTEITFARNEVDQELAPTPGFLGTFAVNPDSPFFAPDVQQALNGIRTDTNGDGVVNGDDNAFLPFIGRRFEEVGSRQSLDTRSGIRALVGLKGDINENWSYDAYFSRSNLDLATAQNGNLSRSAIRQAALVTDDGTACQDPSGGCAPLNIFGAGNISSAAAQFVAINTSNITDIQQQVFQASVSGILGSIGTADAPVGVVFGVEQRKDESGFRPDNALSTGDVVGFNGGAPTIGSFDVDELFTEISLPITNKIELWGAGRYSDYSNIGGVGSFATAFNFTPTEKLRFRVGYQQAVRAPSVSELFLGQTQNFPTANDPCAAGNVGANTSVATCEASGVPVGQVGVFQQANGQVQQLAGGNPNLEEESSDTFTVGLVYQPTDNWDLTLDYYDIEIEDAIATAGGGAANILNLCFNQIQDLSSPICQAITRRADGNVNLVTALNENIANISTSGVDFNVNYAGDFAFGIGSEGSTISWNLRGTYVFESDFQPIADLPNVISCAGNFGATCGSPTNELVVNSRLTWASGPWSVSSLLRYLSSADDEQIENTMGFDPTSIATTEISDEFYLDVSASYRFSDDFSVNFGINNILDTEPTAVSDTQGEQANTFPSTYDLLGPRFFVSGSYRFR